MNHAIFAGTFDPITLGHESVLRRAASLFETVTLAVAKAPARKTLLTFEERLTLAGLAASSLPNVTAEGFDGLLIHFAEKKGASALIRGIRGAQDFEYEAAMALANEKLSPGLVTVFLPASSASGPVSATLVREIFSLGGDIRPFVSPKVCEYLSKKRSGR